MHHHGSAGHGGVIQGLLLVALIVSSAVHLTGRVVRSHRRVDSYLFGHASMTAGMAWMLLPASWVSGPPTALASYFGVSSGWFALLLVRGCRRSLWTAALRYGDLVIGHGAMVYMLGPGGIRFSPVTAVLVGYFLLLALVAVAIVLGRSVTLDLPEEMYGGAAEPPVPGRVSRFAESVSTPSAFAHASMAVAMVYMLARL